MAEDNPGDITILLRSVHEGSPGAADRLLSLVYQKLKQIARNRVREGGPSDIEPTTLVHEAYIKLFRKQDSTWENRHHFFWAAARAMRDILVDNARRRHADKRGGNRRHLSLDDECAGTEGAKDLLEIDEAMKRLEVVHPRAAQIVMLRFFAGLTREQIAEVTGVSASEVWREWNFAKAWLLAEVEGRSK